MAMQFSRNPSAWRSRARSRTNKLRPALTMLGVTIGVFSVIGVMTAISAHPELDRGGPQLSRQQHLSVREVSGHEHQRIRNDTYREPPEHHARGGARVRAADGRTGAARSASRSSTAASRRLTRRREDSQGLTLVGTNEHFLVANSYTLGYGRNLSPEDVDLARSVTVVGADDSEEALPERDRRSERRSRSTRSRTRSSACSRRRARRSGRARTTWCSCRSRGSSATSVARTARSTSPSSRRRRRRTTRRSTRPSARCASRAG